ncbi:MAG: hypothetical protein DYG98_01650 [Haliscomenobacteraceae bacterium CHB4]|nr:hypothetical protein [Haliscomenobacteraceae bacterium CHB4]
MSKKRFSEGLDDLFNDTHSAEENLLGAGMAVAHSAERKSAHKNFMADLDSLLQEALEESLERYDANQPDTTTPSGKTKATGASITYRPPLTGLDALIRQTIDVQEINTDEATGKKRLTVTVDRTKLEKLKTIARLENSYMKDLLVQLIDDYIEEYTQQKGLEL